MEYLAYILISIGTVFYLISVIGVFRFNFALNRMHAAAIGDTLGMTFIALGLIILEGFNFNTLKIIFVLMLMALTGPISTHLISKLEYLTDENLKDHCDMNKVEGKYDNF